MGPDPLHEGVLPRNPDPLRDGGSVIPWALTCNPSFREGVSVRGLCMEIPTCIPPFCPEIPTCNPSFREGCHSANELAVRVECLAQDPLLTSDWNLREERKEIPRKEVASEPPNESKALEICDVH